MAGNKFIKLASGRLQEESSLQSSAGAGDAGKIVALDASGRIDGSMMPVGIGADTASVTASESLASGDFVNIWDDAGTVKVRKADSTTSGKEADGFVLEAFSASAAATVYFEGRNTGLTGLTKGARYYLGTTAGAAVSTVPSAAGNVVQYLGRAISATELAFEGSEGVILA